MGGVSSSIGDLFYRDNPNRRRRVNQLRIDVEMICFQFESIKKEVDKEVEDFQPKLIEVLKENGFATFDDLNKAVEQVLSGEALKQWRELVKKRDRNSAIESIAFAISGILTLGTGALVGGAYLLGLISGAAAISTVSTIGAVLAVVAAIVVIWAVIQAAKERRKLQDAIHTLAFARVDAMQALRHLEAYRETLGRFRFILSSNRDPERSESMLEEYINGEFKEIMLKAERAEVIKELEDKDRHRPEGAWRNEDPWLGFSLPASGRTAGKSGFSLEEVRGKSAWAIAETMITPTESKIQSGASGTALDDDRNDELITPRILLQFDPAHTPDDGKTAVRDFSPIATIAPTASEVRDNETNEVYRVDVDFDPNVDEKPDHDLVKFTMQNLSSFVVTNHVGFRIVQTFSN